MRGEGLFNLEETMVSVLHTELEYIVRKVKYKLVVMQPRIKNKYKLLVGETTLDQSVHLKFYPHD